MDRFIASRRLERMFDSPEDQGVDDRLEVASGLGQAIPDLPPGGWRLADEKPGVLKPPQQLGQARWGDLAEPAGQITKPARARQEVANDQQRPPFAHDLQAAGHHAEVLVDAVGTHRVPVPLLSRYCRSETHDQPN
jgi:hypothetical protein